MFFICNTGPKKLEVLEASLKEEWYRLVAQVSSIEHENSRQKQEAAKFNEDGTIQYAVLPVRY